MAFDYDTNPTGVFFRSGKLVKKINAYLSLAQTTYPADRNEIATPYESANLGLQLEGMFNLFQTFQNNITNQRNQLGQYVNNTFLDQVTVLEQLGVTQAAINNVLPALLQNMLDNSKTVKKCTVTIGAVTASGSNVGNGSVLTTKVLDGFNPPLQGALANIRYNGLNSELAFLSETQQFLCAADSMTGGTTEGAESFAWSGNPPWQTLDWRDEGSGQGPTVRVMNGSRLLNDGDFENWGGAGNNTPTNWTIDAGLAGTNIFRNSVAANVHRGTYDLQMTGDGATATIQVSQAIAASILKARRMYCLSVRIKASAVPLAGTININFTGTGYSAASSEKINIAAASFPTGAFTTTGSLFNFFISTPNIIPPDWKMVIQITGTLSNGINVFFDSMALQEVTYFGGIGAVLAAGSTRFINGDKFTFLVTNDAAGVWQSFFRRFYKFQLPSATAGAETLSDSLAT